MIRDTRKMETNYPAVEDGSAMKDTHTIEVVSPDKGADMPVAFIRLDLAGISDANLKEFTKFLEEGWDHALKEGRPMVIGTNMQLYYRHEGKYYSLGAGESRGSGEGP